MLPNSFYRMKDFANPRTMFKSCANNNEFDTKGPQKVESPTDVNQPAAAPRPIAVPQSTEVTQSEKTQEPKNAPKKTSPSETQKRGKGNRKGKKNHNHAPRTPSQTSKSGRSKNRAKDGKSTGKDDKEKGKGQGKQKVPQQSTCAQYKMIMKKNVQEKKVSEENLVGQKVQIRLSEQKLLGYRLETRINRNTYPLAKKKDSVVGLYKSSQFRSLNNKSDNILTIGAKNAEPLEPEEAEEPEDSQHPLNNCWTLWYLENDRTKSWEEMLHKVTSFDTVEKFWSLITHIKPPSELKLGSHYSLFKKGIRPMWEDKANVNGGRWILNITKNAKSALDSFWMDAMLCLIGEACEHSDNLCGVVVNIRGRANKISIWIADGENESLVLEIGRILRKGLRIENGYVLEYQLHKDSKDKLGSTVKRICTI
ncbi:uncharacterized protein LOC6615946 [Drosophila sechellia]|uniref:GM18997 n=1 Tax=Drosophila sechellia TaxID=7238 RepID=B4I9A3_DROSE|nr:uncharacterized protein LOC6615946 [Drosophila sechellia]EDW43784.1 GM18997 [Drosophila sechellia]